MAASPRAEDVGRKPRNAATGAGFTLAPYRSSRGPGQKSLDGRDAEHRKVRAIIERSVEHRSKQMLDVDQHGIDA
jgi:hypothetical protein